MFLNNILGQGGLSGNAAIKFYSGVGLGTTPQICNELGLIVSGVTQLPSAFMGAWATGVKLDFASSSANDAAAGTGLRTFTMYGLGPLGVPQVKVYTLNGTTVVTTADFWTAVFAITGTTFGSGGVPAGNVAIVATGTGGFVTGVPATVTSGILQLLAGQYSAYSGYYTVPAITGAARYGKMLMKQLQIAVLAQACRVQLVQQGRVTDNTPNWDGQPAVWFDRDLAAGAVITPTDLLHADSLSPGTDIVAWITPAVAGAVVSGSLDLG